MQSLCNACGIRFKKEERRAIAASDTPMSSAGPTAPLIMDPQQMINNSWIHNTDTQRMHCLSPAITNEFRFIEDNRYESDNTGYQFPPWRLNVTDRPGLVHDFTRWIRCHDHLVTRTSADDDDHFMMVKASLVSFFFFPLFFLFFF